MPGTCISTNRSYFLKSEVILYECHICGAYTDKIQWVSEESYIRNGFPGAGKVLDQSKYSLKKPVCCNSKVDWHTELSDKLRLLIEKPHPGSYRDELIREIISLRNKHKENRKDDVEGLISRPKILTEPYFDDEKGGDVSRRVWSIVAPLIRREQTEK